ncbi:MAG: 4-hydroxythreonine-4-phosphate dehydrogenase PdxA [Methylobacteriaceae bacterium]|nr:4-hydroxythreonine-4-phosphate dehydrogenase PdxA [Methylobacteriaceae bacterium]
MTRGRKAPPLALTQGDPAGIGPEIALKAWLDLRDKADAPFFVLGDPAHFERTARAIGFAVPVVQTSAEDAERVFAEALPIVPLKTPVIGTPGQPSSADAAATIEAIERAVEMIAAGSASAVVTNPIAKDVLYAAGFRHPGHTEFLGALALRHFMREARAVMMLWSPELAVVPATIHIPLANVPAKLTRELLIETGLIVAKDMVQLFGIPSPRLAFCGLNPHAGESGSIGREEIDIIAPALKRLRREGVDVSGPFPADTMFHAAARERYDAVIAMYHDQALVPIKTIAFDSAVNVTLGLPFVRTSPDHGTAFDIAGQGKANPASLIAALHLAARLAGATPAR